MMKPLDPKYRIKSISLPKAVWDLSASSSRPVIHPDFLFFRESKPTFVVPDLKPWDKYGAMLLNHTLYYLWQSDGSLAVYAYLYGGTTSTPDKSYGCMYVGRVHPNDWALGGAE
jgi:hypothetical protein